MFGCFLGWGQKERRVEAACRRANTFGMVSLRRIRSMLQTQMDKDPLPTVRAFLELLLRWLFSLSLFLNTNFTE